MCNLHIAKIYDVIVMHRIECHFDFTHNNGANLSTHKFLHLGKIFDITRCLIVEIEPT